MRRLLLENATSIFQGLLTLYPADFRREFGPEMAEVFGYQCQAAYDKRGLWRVARVWLITLALLPGSVWQEHRAVWQQHWRLRLAAAELRLKYRPWPALFFDFPQQAIEAFFVGLLYLPGGPLTSLFFGFLLGGLVACMFNDLLFGLFVALMFIPAVCAGSLLAAFGSEWFYMLVCLVRRTLGKR